jgi:predicted ATP-grasp superfamily ATP-dependent carboligase
MNVIVTNARNRVAYNVVRSLGEKGIPICTADFVPRSMSFFSRYSSSHFVYPSPFSNQEGFIERLLEEIEHRRAEVLIPVFEETFLIARHADRFSKLVSMVLPAYEKILVAHNKDAWTKIAHPLQVPVPATFSLEDLQSGKISASDIRYPALVKPKQGGGAWGIRQVNSSDDLEILLSQDSFEGLPWSRFFVQEKIEGETHCVAMLFNQGKLRAKVAYKQLRDYPATGGQATQRISLRSESAEAHLQRLLEDMNWHGVCQADFIVDKTTRIPHLIDLNPRLWGSLVQAIASGVDFPYLLYRMAREGDIAPVPGFKTGVITRWIGGEFAAFLPHLKRSPHKLRFLKSFFFPSVRAAAYDDFSLSDPLPFFTWLVDTLLKAVKFRSLKAVSHEALEGIWK